MKPRYILITAMLLLIGTPSSSSAQSPKKEERKIQTTKSKKGQNVTPSKRTPKALTTGQSSQFGEPTSPAPQGVPEDQVQKRSSTTLTPVESVRPIVLRDQKSPGLALALSAMLPGCGQYYNGDYLKGAIQTGIFAAGVVVALTLGTESSYSANPYTDYGYYGTYTYYRPTTEESNSAWLYVGIGVATGAWLWSVIDAPLSAGSANDEARNSDYGHMIESSYQGCVVGVDVAALQKGMGLNLAIHF